MSYHFYSTDAITSLPKRMGRALRDLFTREGMDKHEHKIDVIDEIWSADHYLLPLDAPDEALYRAADSAARECYQFCADLQSLDAILSAIHHLCERLTVAPPAGEEDNEIIRRALDKAWWLRGIRKAHARRCEHMAIRLGFTSYNTGPYVSNETAYRQQRRNKQNAKLLASIELQNENGQIYSLDALAALGLANKSNRRGELMTRIRGFEEIAFDLGHVGLFATITAPSKYHAVLSKSGESNPKYIEFGEPTPRDAQLYLCDVWKRIRSKLHRDGIHAYGFRIAEPHHDGCPHWHMLMFVPPEHQERYEAIITAYALIEDGDERGADKNRVKLVRIEADKGTAAGYIAKYIAKNIDGEHVGDHHMREDGRTYIVTDDLAGDELLTPSQRVCYWAQTWGIRQFQQVGGAPIGPWRELRRVKSESIVNAPDAVKTAWQAAQTIRATETNIVDGKRVETVKTIKQASYSDYLRAQGGPLVGRKGLVKIATRSTLVEGKYATYETEKPCGIYHAWNPRAVYESVRYQWTVVGAAKAVAFDLPWTGVNNCTQKSKKKVPTSVLTPEESAAIAVRLADFIEKNPQPAYQPTDWSTIEQKSRDLERNTKDFADAMNMQCENTRRQEVAAYENHDMAARKRLVTTWAAIGACPYPRIFITEIDL
ncbi:Bacteriophage replication gene A protein (GPA) [Collimonas sp. OK607]|uniref:replication endonuclease n=1 Tax=Collimonas sp. OK607 TaxID=1798194 RepID=UPI0008EBDBBF|nr:replication endonuclease [Collimonas sp. OK607]SFB12567.1 Bacteriophage replication gene A protein (GPA) [Collimonas sp. OK607]